MEKYAWKARLLSGMREEYIRRHREIWPEMQQVLTEAGIVNYTVWLSGNELFGYYECLRGIEHASTAQLPRGGALERIHARRDGHGRRPRNGRATATRTSVFFRLTTA